MSKILRKIFFVSLWVILLIAPFFYPDKISLGELFTMYTIFIIGGILDNKY